MKNQQPELICLYDKDLKLTYANPAYCEWLGISKDGLIGTSILDQLAADESIPLITGIKSLTPENRVVVSTRRSLKQANTPAIIEWADQALFDDSGTLTGYLGIGRDITEHEKQAQELQVLKTWLQEQRNQLTTVLDTMQDAIISLSLPDHRLIYASASIEKIFGYSLNHILETPDSFKQIVHPQDLEQVNQALETCMLDGHVELEHRIIWPDGQIRWIYRRAWIILDNASESTILIDTARDITQPKLAELALQKSENTLKLFVEYAPASIVMFDRNMRYLAVSHRWLSENGLSGQSIIGRSHYEVVPEIPQRWREIHRRCLAGAIEKSECDPFPRADGTLDWVRWETHPWRDNQGEIGGILLFSEIITDRIKIEEALRESETRFRNTFELNAVGIAHVSPAGNFLRINRRLCELVGYTSEELLAKTFQDITYQADLETELEFVRQILDGEIPSFSLESRYICKNGRIIWVNLSVTLVRAEKEEPDYFIWAVEDITEKKQSQEEIRKLSQAAEQSPASIVITDRLGNIEYVNQKFSEITGYSKEEAHGNNPRILKSGETPPEVYRQLWATITSGEEWHGELHNRKKNGELYWEQASIAGVKDPDGQVTNFVAVKEDITQRKLVDEQLRHLNRALTLTREATRLIVRSQSISNLFENICNLCVSKGGFLLAWIGLVDRETTEVQPVAWAGFSRDYIEKVAVKLNDESRSSGPTGLTARYGRRHYSPDIENDPRMVPWQEDARKQGFKASAAFPLKVMGEVRGVLTLYASHTGVFNEEELELLGEMADDVSFAMEYAEQEVQRRAAEEALQQERALLEQRVLDRTAALEDSRRQIEVILNNNPEAILLVSKELTIEQANGAFEEFFNSRPGEYLGRSLFDLVLPEDIEILKTFIKTKTAGIEHQHCDVRARRRDGTVFYAAFRIGTMPGGAFVCTIADISVRKRAEELLQQSLEAEKQVGELKSRFVSMASHEFRTPLSTILATTESLLAYRKRMNDGEVDQKLNKVKDQVGYLKNIMEDVLQLSRLQGRHWKFNPVMLDLDELCRNIIEEFKSRPDITHSILYVCEKNPGRTLLDEKLMRQIISNLVSNAIKYSPNEKPVSIRLKSAGDFLELGVADEGIGISENDLKHLFDTFHRGENVGAISGTGLGLVITKEAVDLHSGTIEVITHLGAGTTFKILLPSITV